MGADADNAPVPDFRPELSLRHLLLKRERLVVLALLPGRYGHCCDGVVPQLELLSLRSPGSFDPARQSFALLGSPRARGAEGVLVFTPKVIIP